MEQRKKLTRLLMFVGMIVGGYLPLLWGASVFSFSSLIFSALGAILGVFIAFKLTRF